MAKEDGRPGKFRQALHGAALLGMTGGVLAPPVATYVGYRYADTAFKDADAPIQRVNEIMASFPERDTDTAVLRQAWDKVKEWANSEGVQEGFFYRAAEHAGLKKPSAAMEEFNRIVSALPDDAQDTRLHELKSVWSKAFDSYGRGKTDSDIGDIGAFLTAMEVGVAFVFASRLRGQLPVPELTTGFGRSRPENREILKNILKQRGKRTRIMLGTPESYPHSAYDAPLPEIQNPIEKARFFPLASGQAVEVDSAIRNTVSVVPALENAYVVHDKGITISQRALIALREHFSRANADEPARRGHAEKIASASAAPRQKRGALQRMRGIAPAAMFVGMLGTAGIAAKDGLQSGLTVPRAVDSFYDMDSLMNRFPLSDGTTDDTLRRQAADLITQWKDIRQQVEQLANEKVLDAGRYSKDETPTMADNQAFTHGIAELSRKIEVFDDNMKALPPSDDMRLSLLKQVWGNFTEDRDTALSKAADAGKAGTALALEFYALLLAGAWRRSREDRSR